jgi:hypothetical protein
VFSFPFVVIECYIIIIIIEMGCMLQGGTYVKGSYLSLQPHVAYNVDRYKVSERVPSSTNIFSALSHRES